MTKRAIIKRSLLAFAALLFLLSAVLLSCNNSATQAGSTQTAVNDSVKNADSIRNRDITAFKNQMTDSIASNDRTIAKLKEETKHEGNKIKEDYKKETEVVEQKNKELKKKIDQYSTEGEEKWDVFKTECSKDMDSLRAQIKGLASRIAKKV